MAHMFSETVLEGVYRELQSISDTGEPDNFESDRESVVSSDNLSTQMSSYISFNKSLSTS